MACKLRSWIWWLKLDTHHISYRFQWAICQVDNLRRGFSPSIRSILADLPESLDETYARILLGIDKEEREHARRLRLCASRRPFAHFPRWRAGGHSCSPVRRVQRPFRLTKICDILDAEKAVLSACSSLIAIVNREG